MATTTMAVLVLALLACIVDGAEPSRLEEEIRRNNTINELNMVELGGNYYYFNPKTNQKNWTEARDFCRQHGLELASIESKEENSLVNAQWKKVQYPYSNLEQDRIDALERYKSPSYPEAWLGGIKEGKVFEAHWVWSGTQQNMTYMDWCIDCVNGLSARRLDTTYCVSICEGVGFGGSGSWCESPCLSTNNYICEMPPPKHN